MKRNDFSEVGHTGGKVTFKVKCDENSHVQYQIGYSHSSPTPMSLVGIYAHPDGFACGNIKMGGIGQPWNIPPFPNCIAVLMASDSQGKFGHECPECKKHFRTDNIPAVFLLTCPYCGLRAESYHYLTPPQKSYITHYVGLLLNGCENIQPKTETEIIIDMNSVADSVKEKPRPDFYYSSTTQQTEFRCSECNSYNDIRGRYGYCASCGNRNNVESQKKALEEVRDQIVKGSLSSEDAIKKAVSEFDSASRDYVAKLAKNVPMKESRRNQLLQLLFHNLEKFDEMLKSFFAINLLQGMEQERDFLKMMFLRRHIYEHNGGVVTERYVRESGDQSVEEGIIIIRETPENAHKLIGLLNRMIKTFNKDFNEIFPLEEFCIQIEKDRRSRMNK
jgi:DNA-directed RNA polymerase subunit RPC12/RpoP